MTTQKKRVLNFLSALLIVAGLASALRAVEGGGGGETGSEPPPMANTADAAVMLRAGLGAEALAAAGVSSTDAADAIADALAEHDGASPSLGTLDSDFGSSKSACQALERKVTSGQASAAEIAQCQGLIASTAAKATARQAGLDAIFQAGIATLSASEQATLTTIRGNRSWELPTQYLAKNRSEQAWVDLREALDAVRIANNGGLEPVDQATLDLLAAEDADTTVSGAKASLDGGIASVQTSWNAAVQ